MRFFYMLLAILLFSSTIYAQTELSDKYIVTVTNKQMSILSTMSLESEQDILACFEDDCYMYVDKETLDEMLATGDDIEYSQEVIWYKKTVPNRYKTQWAFTDENVNWLGFTSSANNLRTGLNRDDSPIAVIIDTGVSKHIDIDNRGLLYKCYKSAYGVVTEDSTCKDGEGHGTFVAGVIATADNSGFYGTSYGLGRIYSINASRYNDGRFYESDLIAAMKKVYDEKTKVVAPLPIVVLNMSLGGYEYSQATYDLIKKLGEAEIIVVAAAGNENTSEPHFPSGYKLNNIVSVASIDQEHNLSWFSNFGNSVTIAAPGEGIISTAILEYSNAVDLTDYSTIFSLSSVDFLNLSKSSNWSKSASSISASIANDKYNFNYGGVNGNFSAWVNFKDIPINTTYRNKPIKAFHIEIESNSPSCTYDVHLFLDPYRYYTEAVPCSDNIISADLYELLLKNPNANTMSIAILTNSTAGDTFKVLKADVLYSDEHYGANDGTSFAAPYVAGAILAAKTVYPNASPQLLINKLYSTADKEQHLNGKVLNGNMINLFNFLTAIQTAESNSELVDDYEEVKSGYDSPPVKNSGGGGGGGGGCSVNDGSASDILLLLLPLTLILFIRIRRELN